MRSFALLSDSSCDLPLEYVKQYNIDIYPMLFMLDGTDHREDYWQTLSSQDFYSAMRNGKSVSTSQINRGTLLEMFGRHCENGKDVLFIPLSSGISGTYENALGAAGEVMEKFPDRKVCVLDSTLATMSHGMLLMAGAQKGDEGSSVTEVVTFLEEKRTKIYAFFTVDDLMFLHRGGRVSKFSAIAGSVLGVKPMLMIDASGVLKLKGKVRGRKAALENLVERMEFCVKPGSHLDTVSITHGDALLDAEYVAKLVQEKYTVNRMIITVLGPVIGAHAGPGTITLFFEGDITRDTFEANE